MMNAMNTKTERKPKFAVGDVVHTKRTARVVISAGLTRDGKTRKKTLALLPGTDWRVLAVVAPEGRGPFRYLLEARPYKIERTEVRLRAAR